MGYIVLSKKQVEGSLNVKLCKDKASADSYRKQLIKQYYDVVILDKSDHKLVTSNLFKEWVNEKDNDGGDNNNPDPIWNGESEDLLVNASEENDDLTPQCFHADKDGDEFYMSSNGNHYYLFKKMVTLKGDRARTIYMFGKKEWSRTNDLTLLRFYNIPYDKCVVENKSGYPFLKTEVMLDEQIDEKINNKTTTWDL
tara:strand:+ start:3777 stop:4367 length:591 start_codon:yes stop_codon:yes gene_type:complete